MRYIADERDPKLLARLLEGSALNVLESVIYRGVRKPPEVYELLEDVSKAVAERVTGKKIEQEEAVSMSMK